MKDPAVLDDMQIPKQVRTRLKLLMYEALSY
jgi:hypothetical protein